MHVRFLLSYGTILRNFPRFFFFIEPLFCGSQTSRQNSRQITLRKIKKKNSPTSFCRSAGRRHGCLPDWMAFASCKSRQVPSRGCMHSTVVVGSVACLVAAAPICITFLCRSIRAGMVGTLLALVAMVHGLPVRFCNVKDSHGESHPGNEGACASDDKSPLPWKVSFAVESASLLKVASRRRTKTSQMWRSQAAAAPSGQSFMPSTTLDLEHAATCRVCRTSLGDLSPG